MDILADEDEEPLFRPLLHGESGKAEWRAYRDWLLARDDVRGELMSLLEVLEQTEQPAGASVMRERLRALVREVDPQWLRYIRRYTRVLNCGQLQDDAEPLVRFKYECPRSWESLQLTETPMERHCDACRRTVYLCTDTEQAENRARSGHCIAVPSALARKAESEAYERKVPKMMTLGMPQFVDNWPSWGKELFAAQDRQGRRKRGWRGMLRLLRGGRDS